MSLFVTKLNPTYNSSVSIKRTRTNVFSKKIFIFNLVLITLIFVIFVLYIFKINQLIILGFRLNELEQKSEEMRRTNKTLELEKIRLESFNHPEGNFGLLDFVSVEKVDYLRPIGGVTLTQR